MIRVGIDLGTTNTAVAIVQADGPRLLPIDGPRLIPSAVLVRPSGPPLVGTEAANDPKAVVSVKRLMGRSLEDAQAEGAEVYFGPRLARGDAGEPRIRVRVGKDQRLLWPEEVSALILRRAVEQAEAALGARVDQAVVTVPAYFRDPHRAATLEAARRAGLEVCEPLLDEPAAVALAFSPVVALAPGEPVLVVDWGGGTLDCTVVMSNGSEWMQLAVEGDLVLGGDDVDDALASRVAGRLGLSRLLADEWARFVLRSAARQAKEQLSTATQAVFAVRDLVDPEGGRPVPAVTTVSRADLDAVLAPALAKVEEVVTRCVERPGVDRHAIRKVLLAGGSTLIPAVRALLARLLPEARQHDEVDPMEAVAVGAAIMARERPEVARVCPYGFAVVDDTFQHHVLIPPNMQVPMPSHAACELPASTRYDGQTMYRLSVAEFHVDSSGERHFHARRRLFATGLPGRPEGSPVVVRATLDINKSLGASCVVNGTSWRLTGQDHGADALFNELQDARFEAEACAEANRRDAGPLIDELVAAATEAGQAARKQDRPLAQQLLERLGELQEQIVAKEVMELQCLPDADAEARSRVRGWVVFLEQDSLPKLGPLLPPAARDAAIGGLRGLRVMMQTGAGPDELWTKLWEVERVMESVPRVGPLCRAYRMATLVGMPERVSGRLREAVDKVLAEGPGGRAAAEVDQALAEAEKVFQTWARTGSVVSASPDLVIEGRAGGGDRG